MAFMDEEILKQKRKMEDAQKQFESQKNMEAEAESSIYDEQVMIMGNPVHFERREIEGIGVSIMMPTTFFRFEEDITRMVYPAGNPPTHLYGGENIPFQISMNLTEHKIPNDKIKDFLKLSEQMIKAVGPRATIVDKVVKEKEDYQIAILSFVTRAMDMMVFNNQFYLTVGENLLIGTVNFPSKYKKRFMNMAQEIIMSVEKEDDHGSDNPS